jgi:guanine deaminase
VGGWDFSGCEIYSTTEPCVMCFAAVNWARMDGIRFGTTVGDAARLGFNELIISNRTLKRMGGSRIEVIGGVMRPDCLKLLEAWKALPRRRTY